MKLIAIILNYNTPELTIKAIISTVIALETETSSKILVVDNASTDNSFSIIQTRINKEQVKSSNGWDKVELLPSPVNGGFGAGNNLAISNYMTGEHAAEYFYILNSDAFPEKDAIRELLKHLEDNPQTGFAGSYIYGINDEPHTTAFRFPSIWGEFEGAIKLGIITRLLRKYVVPLGIPDETTQVDWLAGASMMIRADTLKEIGLFDEEFFLYYEETDLCRRGLLNGWRTDYVTTSAVCHVGSASTGMKVAKRIPKYWFDSRRHYFKKNHGTLYFLAATLFRIVGEVGYRIRSKIERKDHGQPESFILDLFLHTLYKSR